ncbi:NAD(P)-dependent oxidoreductase [Candidatus Dojkabacteria bacterium]|jgi:dTDP-4-dehydrorhamnose reductase|nr:NAD(P)-dependent oxidoreductase [Candidatus Dojkabacteria bacterium]
MRVLITGAGGMLGDAVYNELKNFHDVHATSSRVTEEWITQLDVSSADAVEECFREVMPHVVIHLAALTDLEYCHLHPDQAYKVNFIGALNVAKSASIHGAILVHISTGAIFDGKKESYREDDLPNPLNIYAKSKLAGELAARSFYRHIVIRAGWMMGGGPEKDKTFTNKIIQKIKAGAKELFIVNDTFGTITYTPHLAVIIHNLFSKRNYGIHHVGCINDCSRVEIAEAILWYFNLDRDISITQVPSDHFKNDYFVVRPASERIITTTDKYRPYWRICLEEYLHAYKWGI